MRWSLVMPAPRARAATLLLLAVLSLHVVLLSSTPPRREAPGTRPAALTARHVVAVPAPVLAAAAIPGTIAASPPPSPPAGRPSLQAAHDLLAREPRTPANKPPGAGKRADTSRPPPHRPGPQQADSPALPVAALADAPTPAADGDGAPLRPTEPPPSSTVRYELRRGPARGQAELSWQQDGARYAASLVARFDGGIAWQWSSRGGFDVAGVAPERFVTQGRRAAAAVNFQRDVGRISFSGPTVEHPLTPGAQDRLSWMLQLAAIAQARVPAAGETIAMQVAGPRGDAERWRFDVIGLDRLETEAGAVPALRLRRAALRRHDTRIEVWLDPGRHHLPVRALLSNQEDGRDALELQRVE